MSHRAPPVHSWGIGLLGLQLRKTVACSISLKFHWNTAIDGKCSSPPKVGADGRESNEGKKGDDDEDDETGWNWQLGNGRKLHRLRQ